MAQARQERGRGIGADGTVKRAPVVQRIGQGPHPAQARSFRLHHQGQDAHRPAVGADHQYAQSLGRGEVPAIDFQPVQRLEEGGAGGLREQGVPEQSPVGELLRIVDFFDVDHGIPPPEVSSGRIAGISGRATRVPEPPAAGVAARAAASQPLAKQRIAAFTLPRRRFPRRPPAWQKGDVAPRQANRSCHRPLANVPPARRPGAFLSFPLPFPVPPEAAGGRWGASFILYPSSFAFLPPSALRPPPYLLPPSALHGLQWGHDDHTNGRPHCPASGKRRPRRPGAKRGGAADHGGPAGRRAPPPGGRAGGGQDAGRQGDGPQRLRGVPSHPVHARPAARRHHRQQPLSQPDAGVHLQSRVRSSPTWCWPTRSTGPRRGRKARCWKR